MRKMIREWNLEEMINSNKEVTVNHKVVESKSYSQESILLRREKSYDFSYIQNGEVFECRTTYTQKLKDMVSTMSEFNCDLTEIEKDALEEAGFKRWLHNPLRAVKGRLDQINMRLKYGVSREQFYGAHMSAPLYDGNIKYGQVARLYKIGFKFDQYGHYGLSIEEIEQLKNYSDSKLRILSSWEDRAIGKDAKYTLFPKHGETNAQYKNFLRGAYRIHKVNPYYHLLFMDRRLIQSLGKISSETAYFVIREIINLPCEIKEVREFTSDSGSYTKNIKGVWRLSSPEVMGIFSKASVWTKQSKVKKADDMSAKFAWYFLRGKLPLNLNRDQLSDELFNQLVHPNDLGKVERKSLMKLGEISDYQDKVAILKIVQLFRTIDRVKKWLSNYNGSFHDAGQFTIPARGINTEFWGAFVLRNQEAIHYTGRFRLIERKFGLPKSLTEFRQWANSFKYDKLVNEEIIELSSKYNLSQNHALDYEKCVEKEIDSFESIPNFRAEIESYVFEKMEWGDKEGLYLGLATHCCQHLHNDASSCAIAGYRNGYSGFYVIRKDGEIVAQSWAWRSKNDWLVIDNIEAKGEANRDVIAELYKSFMTHVKEHKPLILKGVKVGNTSYGIGRKVKKYLNGRDCKPSKMIHSVEYDNDSREQWKL